MSPYGERIAKLEIQVQDLANQVSAMDKKLDDLLALKYKGAGALWLVTLIIGAALMAVGSKISNIFGG